MELMPGWDALAAGFAGSPLLRKRPCMNYRALRRLQHTATLTLAGPSSLTHLLQTAACQAWTRHVSSFSATSTRAPRERIHQRSFRSCYRPVRKSRFTPESTRKYGDGIKMSRSDSEYLHTQDRSLTTSTNSLTSPQNSGKSSHSVNLVTNLGGPETGYSDPWLDLVNSQSHKLRSPILENTPNAPPKNTYLLLPPTSCHTLYDNLQRAICIKPRLNPPILIDYHESYPQFRSTRSYNFLIEFAIRHTHFGTAQWLFNAMNHAGLVRNKDTHRLFVKWLVRTGRWEQAWAQATGLTPEQALDKPLRRGLSPIVTKISCPVWLELLWTFQRSGLRRPKDIRRGIYEDKPDVLLPTLEVIKDPTPGTEACLRRQRLLACVQPIMEPSKWIRPSVMRAFIYPIVRSGQSAEAIKIAKAYFSTLPVEVSRGDVARCLDIIHLLLSVDISNGLISLLANRKLLLSLLGAHASLKPSPKTLFLLLSPLKRAKKSGTVAFKIFKAFEKTWGPKVIDVTVRRRVIRLAEKEGRKDLVQMMLDGPTTARIPQSGCNSGYCRVPTTFISGPPRLLDKESFAHTKGT